MSSSSTKYCKGCEEEKDLDAFYRKRDSICKLCTNEYQREQRKNKKASSSSEDIVVSLRSGLPQSCAELVGRAQRGRAKWYLVTA